MRRARIAPWSLVVLLALCGGTTLAQLPQPHEQDNDLLPPTAPPKPPAEDVPEYEDVSPKSDLPWGLSEKLLEPLYSMASVYQDYTRRFTCEEVARSAEYKGSGEMGSEDTNRYGYLLVRDSSSNALREYRQVMGADGTLKGTVRDEEPFPPAYAWVFLFHRFNEPYFNFRYLGDKFDGFDWVHEIEFQGSIPFTHGKDIRQWEGTVLIDAVTYTPLEIRAEPAGQRERIELLYRNHAKAFKFFGLSRTPKPMGFSAFVQFRYRRDGLTFPTELRYDTFRAVSPRQVTPVRASTRTYENYRITLVTTEPEVGEKVEP